PGAGLEPVARAEQRLSGHHVHVDARSVVVPVLVVERRLRRLVLGHLVLYLGQRPPQLGVAWLGVVHARAYLRRRGFGAPYFPQAPAAAARHPIHAVPPRTAAIAVLVLGFRRAGFRRLRHPRLERLTIAPFQ